ncbi:hypothetical protein A0J61_08109 [Choanephora cucurbitarum]|uniref:Uncharacterized protein n=1 Tax=Choanephora cucurbitarum TaxID=101091 RepID=A0A1C7N3X1_9FUNG|nr:hypothetical protein A0J61_08109 [Choanephora cucurbitarum]
MGRVANISIVGWPDGYCVAKKEGSIHVPNDERLIAPHLEDMDVALFKLKAPLSTLNDEIFVKPSNGQRKRKSYDDMPHTLLSPEHV